MNAVYDRTQADVDNLTEKGFVNYTDLNRLETNIETIANKLNVSFTKKTWVVGDLPRASDYTRLKTAVDAIKSKYDVLEISPNRPFNTFVKWNQLEYLIYYTDYIFDINESEKAYCGEFYCGETGLI